MTTHYRMLVLISSAAIGGCASMSKSECANANWEQRGFTDGQYGSPTTVLLQHTKACSRINVVPDTDLYLKGHSEGIELFCTPRNGLRQGKRNADYQYACPRELESAFLNSYIDGLQLKLNELEQELNSHRSKLFTLRLRLLTARNADKSRIISDINNLENALSENSAEQLSVQTRISESRIRIQDNAS